MSDKPRGAFLRTWGSNWDENGPTGLVTRYHLQTHGQTPEQRRLVIISSVLPDRYKWWLFGATMLSIFLSWGKNWQWFSDLFFDNFPMYNRFRAVSSVTGQSRKGERGGRKPRDLRGLRVAAAGSSTLSPGAH